MIRKLMTLTALAVISGQALATDVINHKSPNCGCCTQWTEHMRDAGFNVTEKLHNDMNPIKQKMGIPSELTACHTAEINGYVFEGHISPEDVKAFLDNPPNNAIGLAVPGMPIGSSGMEYGDKKDEYSVYAFNKQGQKFEYRHYNGK
ncbi:DUF411 domain-containing protein [Vibrio artabrorum]|uniref:DUF411 domain-containing protein n=1 Tax=Vibrio artabrorum TaxID=446374 RepID=A0ABT8CE94_9VIBR|nr:DUF411 domain-containing protein [Vibrio artabrorum]MDN3700041.1 DUF411 domain-containing protein [Vibrio artabrorum]